MQLLRPRLPRPIVTICAALLCCACRAEHGQGAPPIERTVGAAGQMSVTAAPSSVVLRGAERLPERDRPTERVVAFPFSPRGANPRAYAMTEPADQHQLTLMQGVASGQAYPLVIALHGQPRPGAAPRTYRFPKVVAEVTRELVQGQLVGPLILVTPVFRFEGENWPSFQLGDFLVEVRRRLAEARVGITSVHVFGHSGAAGCGGRGLNHVAEIRPDSVGLFDTCIGEGFLQLLRQLDRERTPTLVMHSVETAGARPRRTQEYDAHFDFGALYARAGIRAAACPRELPDAPLRRLASPCARNAFGTMTALVVDTGQGEAAHEALVPVALRYYLRHFVMSPPSEGIAPTDDSTVLGPGLAKPASASPATVQPELAKPASAKPQSAKGLPAQP